MTDEVRLLFHELAELSPDERQRALAHRQIKPEVRAEVESLLRNDSSEAQGFTACIAGAAGELLQSAPGPGPGFCGPYRLVRLLGRGGMGAVYLGERDDGEIQQKVAVKLLSAEGDRPGWQERFLRERQLLASLNHPSIVRVIDAGHTEDGRPFLVMEYVEGTPIDVFAPRIPARDRLNLFLRVCDGVSHAHGRLIIHRDLKPSNILVEQSGQPKLLDFGIAKLLAETRDATQTAERILTPNYASPEQFRGGVQTTATDIYSLGAVLYKLLTGRSPHESDTHTSNAMDVIAGTRETLAPSRLNPDVATDLDYIVGKALRIEPEERYASVEAFANDTRAFLESRPVQARSSNAWYRTRKFLRRHWAAVAAGSLVVASLSVGLHLANRERAIAQRRFMQIRQLSNRVFALDNVIKSLPGSIEARQNLVSAALEYLEGLATDARRDPDLAREVGEGYWRIARTQGVPIELNLGDEAQADASLKKADELMEVALAAHPKDRTALFRSAVIAHDRMILAQENHRATQAVTFARQAATRLEEVLQAPGVLDSERIEAAGDYTNLAMVHNNLHLYREAASYARRGVEIARPIPSARRHVSFGLGVLASSLRYQGDLNGALQTIQEAVRVSEQITYRDKIQRMIAMIGVLLPEGSILGEDGGVNLGRPEEAIEILRKAFELPEEIARADRVDATSRIRVGNIGEKLGNILRHYDPGQALAVYDVAIQRLGEVPRDLRSRQDQASILADSSYALRSLHHPREAQERINRALAILKDTKDYPSDRVRIDSAAFVVLRAAADQVAETTGPERAVELYEELVAHVVAAAELSAIQDDLRNAPTLSQLYESLGRLYRRIGNAPKAEAATARRLALWQYWDQKLPGNAFVRRQLAAISPP